MKTIPTYAKCINILYYCSVEPQVIDHLICTAQTAMEISKNVKNTNIFINCQLIRAGSILHDIGRCKSHNIDHGILGAKILRQKGFPDELARIAENHLFAGINKHEASELGLPFQDYLPLTLEEKIVAYADNISKDGKLLSTNEVIERYSKYLSHYHPIILRINQLHNEIEMLLKNK